MYMLPTRDSLPMEGHTQTEREGMEKDIPCKWEPEKNGVAVLISDKNKLQVNNMTQRRLLYNN